MRRTPVLFLAVLLAAVSLAHGQTVYERLVTVAPSNETATVYLGRSNVFTRYLHRQGSMVTDLSGITRMVFKLGTVEIDSASNASAFNWTTYEDADGNDIALFSFGSFDLPVGRQSGRLYVYDSGSPSIGWAWDTAIPVQVVDGEYESLSTPAAVASDIASHVATYHDMVTEEYTATAGQTVFNLVNTFILGSGTLRVYINGVHQASAAYTETDTDTITMSEGLDAGDLVVVILSDAIVSTVDSQLRTDLASTTSGYGASLVGVEDSAGKLAATTTEAALAEVAGRVWDLRARGATGDGSTDDSTEVAAVIAAAGANSTILVPQGYTFKVTGGVTISANGVTLTGGGTLKGDSTDPSNTAVLTVTGDDVTVEDLTIDQNNISAGWSVHLSGTARATVRDVTFTNVQQAAIYGNGVITDTVISGVRHRGKGYGVLFNEPGAGSAGLSITGCDFDFNGATGLGDGIEINAPTNGFTRYVIDGNTVRGYIKSGTNQGIGIGVANGSYGVISNNQVYDVESDGIHIEDGSHHVAITGNVLYNLGDNGTTGQSGGITVVDSSYTTITGNTIYAALDMHGIFVSGHIADAWISGHRIANNVIRSADKAGIYLSAASQGVVQGNYIVSVNLDAGGYAAIDAAAIGPSTKEISEYDISHNTIVDGSGTPDYAIELANNVVRTRVAFNDLTQSTNKINSSAAVDIHGNKYGSNTLAGSFTATAGTTSVVSNNNAYEIERIRVHPKDAAAAALTGVYVSAVSAGTSFTVTHSTAAGTEEFYYAVE